MVTPLDMILNNINKSVPYHKIGSRVPNEKDAHSNILAAQYCMALRMHKVCTDFSTHTAFSVFATLSN